MLVEEDVFELQVAVDAVLLVHVGDGAHKLGEGLLDFVDGELAMSEEVVVQFLACVEVLPSVTMPYGGEGLWS